MPNIFSDANNMKVFAVLSYFAKCCIFRFLNNGFSYLLGSPKIWRTLFFSSLELLPVILRTEALVKLGMASCSAWSLNHEAKSGTWSHYSHMMTYPILESCCCCVCHTQGTPPPGFWYKVEWKLTSSTGKTKRIEFFLANKNVFFSIFRDFERKKIFFLDVSYS